MVTESKENHNETQWLDSEIGYKNILLSSLNNGKEIDLYWAKFILVAVPINSLKLHLRITQQLVKILSVRLVPPPPSLQC